MKLSLAQFIAGRILLHLLCICRGGDIHFHSAGVQREIKSFGQSFDVEANAARFKIGLLVIAMLLQPDVGLA